MDYNFFKNKSLCIILDDPYYKYDGTYYSTNPLWKFFEEMAPFWKTIILCPPVKKISWNEVKSLRGFQVQKRAVLYVERPGYENKLGFLRKLPQLLFPTIRSTVKAVKKGDIILLRLPSPNALISYFICKALKRKVYLYIAGDFYHRNIQSDRYSGSKIFIKPMVKLYDEIERFLASRTTTFVTGKRLLDKYGGKGTCINFWTSLVRSKDIFCREDTCNSDYIILLFVGKFIPVKGVSTLIKAFSLMEREDIILRLVGDGPLRGEIEQEALRLGVRSRVQFAGAIQFGEELFNEYRQKADIFVLPSLSEGIPKVILEAMAFGLPIVATAVSGIPDLIKDQINGLLVSADSAEELAAAILKMIDDGNLRRSVIKNNLKKIKNFTLESQMNRFLNVIYNSELGLRS